MPEPAFRIGVVSFLNTIPLVEGLDEDPTVLLTHDLPARLADLLYEDRIDVGLVPTVEYLRGVGGDIVPGICIASEGPVRTVKVFSKVPLEEATDIAVDRGSRSSVAMLRVVLAETYGRLPDLHVMEPIPGHLFVHYDTVLIIGDRAEQVDPQEAPFVYDLGELWNELTGLPFVYATWVLSPRLCESSMASERTALIRKLTEAKARGMSRIEDLARREAERRRLPAEPILDYWTKAIRYDLSERELAGLSRFARLAAEHNLCPARDTVSLAEA
jgi:chorismate dehydratase